MTKRKSINEIFEGPDDMEKALTVADLIQHLRTMPQDALVYEENDGEHRALTAMDIEKADGIVNQDSGENEEGSFVIFGAWN